MAIAAAVSLPTHHRADPSLPASLQSPPSLSFGPISLRSFIKAFPNPRLSVSASAMSFQATEKISQASFLDRKESEFLPFVKYHGLGNDFILVDNRGSMEPRVTPEQAAKLCDRNFGIGADGVIFVMPGINGSDYTMRIFNSDGSEPEVYC